MPSCAGAPNILRLSKRKPTLLRGMSSRSPGDLENTEFAAQHPASAHKTEGKLPNRGSVPYCSNPEGHRSHEQCDIHPYPYLASPTGHQSHSLMINRPPTGQLYWSKYLHDRVDETNSSQGHKDSNGLTLYHRSFSCLLLCCLNPRDAKEALSIKKAFMAQMDGKLIR